jgi:hypothetical protein
MKKNFLFYFFIFFTFLFYYSCSSQKKIKYGGIDRTLSLLSASTIDSPNDIEILFYGQSIIGGMKTDILIDSLKNIYPSANITYKHKPIGGFTIPKLVKTVEHDVYHENPDLIVFHAYSGIKDGLYDLLIKNIRNRMASDILLLDHHYVWDKPDTRLNSINKSHAFDSKEIEKIAQKYNCGFVNVRERWGDYLKEKGIAVNELMGNTVDPNVHPNDKGNTLLRSIVLSKLRDKPTFNYSIQVDSLRVYHEFKNNKNLRASFTGNWFQLITERTTNKDAKIKVLIDEKPPSLYRSNYYISRPSKGFKSWMPSILKVSLGKTFPQKENWTLEVYDVNRESNTFKFRLTGDVTGIDGLGNSENDFTSNSGRIQIKKEDFYIFQTENIFKNETPENYKITFSVEQIVRDTITLSRRQAKYGVFRSFNSDNYKIDIEVISGNPIIKALLINQPFLNKNE